VNININNSSEKSSQCTCRQGQDRTHVLLHTATKGKLHFQSSNSQPFTVQSSSLLSHSASSGVLYSTELLRHQVWFSRIGTSVSCELWGQCDGLQKVTPDGGHVLVPKTVVSPILGGLVAVVSLPSPTFTLQVCDSSCCNTCIRHGLAVNSE